MVSCNLREHFSPSTQLFSHLPTLPRCLFWCFLCFGHRFQYRYTLTLSPDAFLKESIPLCFPFTVSTRLNPFNILHGHFFTNFHVSQSPGDMLSESSSFPNPSPLPWKVHFWYLGAVVPHVGSKLKLQHLEKY